jgi:ribose/xylose/arabinose/galactoside ABC-type transport system permease subunit
MRPHLSVLITAGILALLFTVAGLLYDGFFSARVLTGILGDNAFLGIAAVGMTLVIFAGGIDLSVGAVIGFTSILTSSLIQKHSLSPYAAWAIGLAIGGALGAGMGSLIQFFRLPAFLITLAGMFLMRGAGFWISTESVGISHPLYGRISGYELDLGKFGFSAGALIFLAVMGTGYLLAQHTRFGRNLLAVGDNEQSSVLMGLPVGTARIAVYAANGVCSALAGIVATLYTGSGNPSMGIGLELDAIAVVVIGGTLLGGGRGNMLGTLLGVLIFGTIQSAILFDGRLSSSWMRVVVGGMLLAFILLQRLLATRRTRI